jgi:agmatinase
MAALRDGSFDLETALRHLPDPAFLTLDVDALDWSVVRSTGTPEPGGLVWDEITALLEQIVANCRVVGLDVVELSGGTGEPNSAFAVAKLIYRAIGLLLRPRGPDHASPMESTRAPDESA